MTLEGFRPLQARLNAIGNTKGITRRLGIETVAEAKRRVKRKTGTTGRTIRLATVTDEYAIVKVGGAGPYLERGTRPHEIRPRNKTVLRFPAKGTKTTLGGRVRAGEVRKFGKGAYVFARVVHHPGTKAQPFLIPGAKAAVAKVGVGHIVETWNRAA